MEEQWMDSVSYPELFKISNMGNIWSKKRNKPCRQNDNGSGYLIITTWINGKEKKTTGA